MRGKNSGQARESLKLWFCPVILMTICNYGCKLLHSNIFALHALQMHFILRFYKYGSSKSTLSCIKSRTNLILTLQRRDAVSSKICGQT